MNVHGNKHIRKGKAIMDNTTRAGIGCGVTFYGFILLGFFTFWGSVIYIVQHFLRRVW